MKNLKKLTILHSNDMHGDFMAEKIDEKLVGGVSLLSGYIQKVRHDEKNVIYAIAGDMFRGSIIDQEFHGLSTIEITNMLQPDVVTIGNHEADYGLSHLLFIEKCARFPIINSNLYIKTNGVRLFNPYKILHIDGMNILFIGIVTEEVLNQTKSDAMIGSIIDTRDAAREIEKICNAHKSIDIDLTVCLTHIGFENDIKLANMLSKESGVDIIIGGHSHTFLEEAREENGILIVQAGTGTDQIGRFDLMVNTDTNSVESYTWKPIPINAETCPEDKDLTNLINGFKSKTDLKYARVLTRFTRQLSHPARNQETEVGDLFADLLKASLHTDIILLGSGSIRKKHLGPIVDAGQMKETFPYDDNVMMIKVDGKTLRKMMLHVLRDDAFVGETEFYQINKEFRMTYSKSKHEFLEFKYNGQDIQDDEIFKVAMQKFHYNNLQDFLNISVEEANSLAKAEVIATSITDIVETYFEEHTRLNAEIDGRITILD